VNSAARGTVYIVNWIGGATPIPVCTNTPGKPIPVVDGPVAIAITPDGRTAYVANENAGTVTPIDTRTNKVGAPIKLVGRRLTAGPLTSSLLTAR
jgi:YVTN family beta-propeller protein